MSMDHSTLHRRKSRFCDSARVKNKARAVVENLHELGVMQALLRARRAWRKQLAQLDKEPRMLLPDLGRVVQVTAGLHWTTSRCAVATCATYQWRRM